MSLPNRDPFDLETIPARVQMCGEVLAPLDIEEAINRFRKTQSASVLLMGIGKMTLKQYDNLPAYIELLESCRQFQVTWLKLKEDERETTAEDPASEKETF